MFHAFPLLMVVRAIGLIVRQLSEASPSMVPVWSISSLRPDDCKPKQPPGALDNFAL